jgi:hypothetical protein
LPRAPKLSIKAEPQQMFLNAIDPETISLDPEPFIGFGKTRVFYLSYGRNAWYATWINKYYPDSMSFDQAAIKHAAEERRVQGSVFRIESLPLFVVKRASGTYGICEINSGSAQEYDYLLRRIDRDCPSRFFRYLPSSGRNWLLAFDLDGASIPEAPYESFAIRSTSVGPRYYLRWKDVEPEPRQAFLGFCDRLSVVLRDPGRRVRWAQDPSLTQTKAVLRAYVHDDGRVTCVPARLSAFQEIFASSYMSVADSPRYAVVQVEDEFWVTDMREAVTMPAEGRVLMGPYKVYWNLKSALATLEQRSWAMEPKAAMAC